MQIDSVIPAASSPPDPAEWVDRYGDLLYSLALRRMNDSSVAEDLVQETFLAALESRDSFAARSEFSTWLVAILRNKIALHYRNRNHEEKAVTDDALENWVEGQFDKRGVWKQKPKSWPPIAGPEADDFRSKLRLCLERLPRSISTLFVLYERDDITAEALGRVMGLSQSGVWGRLYRARVALRECLDRNWLRSVKPVQCGEAD